LIVALMVSAPSSYVKFSCAESTNIAPTMSCTCSVTTVKRSW
jgi:hypothetical protein